MRPVSPVRFPQRFGGSLNVHVHDHSIFVDGVFTKQADGSIHFVPSRAPTQTEIVAVAAEVGRPVIKWLRRRGYLGRDGGAALEEQTAIEACMQVGMSPGNFERITERGQPDATIKRDDARFDHRKRSPWSGEADGFSVHAGVCMRAGDTDGRERLPTVTNRLSGSRTAVSRPVSSVAAPVSMAMTSPLSIGSCRGW